MFFKCIHDFSTTGVLFWSEICKMSAKPPAEMKMSKKTLAPYQARPQPSPKTLARQADALCERVHAFLADTPALKAAGVLSGLLAETTDPATRLAILTTRIQVLRARTIACQSGRSVDEGLTLGAMLEEQKAKPEPPPPPPESEPEPEVIEASAPPEDPGEEQDQPIAQGEQLAQIKLLQSYEHEGITLPEGAVFAVAAAKAEELVSKGISVFMPSVEEDGAEQTPEDQGSDAEENPLGAPPETDDAQPAD